MAIDRSDDDQAAPVGVLEYRGQCRECGHAIVFRPPRLQTFKQTMSVRVRCAVCRATNRLDRAGTEGEQ